MTIAVSITNLYNTVNRFGKIKYHQFIFLRILAAIYEEKQHVYKANKDKFPAKGRSMIVLYSK